jgi:ferredoxin-thioredoxin reductase catalytic chain
MAQKTPDELYPILKRFAEKKGITLNPDEEFAKSLIEGFLKKAEMEGYRACPCRLTVGDKEWDRDIICPCDYMMEDVEEFGACFCSLYVSNEYADKVRAGDTIHTSIPERRPIEKLFYPEDE